MSPSLPTILVVYDSQAIRETVFVFASDATFDVVELVEPERLLDVVEEHQPDAIILCAMTRNTSAFVNCRALKEISPNAFVPVIVYMLKPRTEDLQRAYEAGADDVVPVTLKPEELQWRIQSLLRVRGFVEETCRRAISLARASAEAADMMLQLEEADRRIREQNDELERMVEKLQERDRRIVAQQAEIARHLETLQKEMELASALQINLLPSREPEVEGLRIHDRYIPAAELCGDYYDYVTRSDGELFVMIADVTGHGVAPALVSVQVRTMARTAIQAGRSPEQVLTELNEFMVDTFKQEFLMTMTCLQIAPGRQTLRLAGAGHCPAIILRAGDAKPTEIYSLGLPLGVTASATFAGEEVAFGQGDRLLLYTDGLTEVVGEEGQGIFGHERLRQVLQERHDDTARDLLDDVLREARRFSAQGVFEDDVTLVLLDRLTAGS